MLKTNFMLKTRTCAQSNGVEFQSTALITNTNYSWFLLSVLSYYLLKNIMPSSVYAGSLTVGAGRAEDSPGRSSLPPAARSALCGLRLLVFIGVWWFLDHISAVLLSVVWRWWCLYYERPSDSRKGLWKRKVLALLLPTNCGFLWSLRASYKPGLLDVGRLNLHPSARDEGQRGKDHEPVLSGGPPKH